MHVLGFTLVILGFVMQHLFISPNSIYDQVEQYKLDCYKYYTTKYEEMQKQKQEPVRIEPTVVSGDLGILKIPYASIEVRLYSDGNAFQSSGKAYVQYYVQYGIKWIADHANQDNFGNLRNLSIGSKVYINDTEYTVVDNVYAADYYSNFSAWVSYIGDSKLILQTCEGDGARLVRCE